jgi:hypothetical protein
MNLIRNVKSIVAIVTVGLMMSGISGFAQTETKSATNEISAQKSQQVATPSISDAKLKKFVDVYKKLAPQQQQAEAQMIKAIEQQGLTADRFNEIASKQQANATPESSGATADELTKFKAAAQQISAIQKDVQPKIEKLMTDEGMKPEEFEQIAMAYQTSPEIQQKIQALMKQ